MNNLHAATVSQAGPQGFDGSAPNQFLPHALKLGALRSKLWKGKGRVLAIAGLFALVAAVYSVLLPPKYVASTRILIEPPHSQSANNGRAPSFGESSANLSVMASQMQVIVSDGVLSRVVKSESLTLDPEFGVKVDFVSMLFGSDPQTKISPDQRALRLLANATSVSRVPGTYVLELSVATGSARKSARLAKAIAETYLNTEIEAKATLAGKTASSITRQLDELRATLKAAEARVEKYKTDNHLKDETGRLVSDQQLSQLGAELISARARAAQARTKFEQIERLQRSGTSLDSLTDAIQSEIVTQLRVRLASLKVRQVAREAVLHPANPELKQMRDQADSLRRQINVELDRIATAAKSEAVRLQTNVLELEQELQKRTGDTVKTNKSLVRLRELEREVQTARAVYDAMLAKARETDTQEPVASTSMRIVSPANVPAGPVGLPLPALLVLGFGVGLLAGSAYVLARPESPATQAPWPDPSARVQERPYAPSGIAQRMAAYSAAAAAAPNPPPPVFPVPPAPAAAPSPVPVSEPFVAPPPHPPYAAEVSLRPLAAVSGLSDPTALYPFVTSDPMSLASAAMGQLNRILRTTRRRGVPQTVVIGSCSDVEARPGIAMNLALSAACSGDRVLLVDAEFSRRQLSTTLASTAVVGLGEIAGGIVSPGDVMIKHPELTVAFVPATESRRGPEPVLTESALRTRVLSSVTGFDLIIFDGGQLQQNASAPALAAIAHVIVLVTEHGPGSPTELQTALEMLGLNQTKVRGTLPVA
ncbi:MAG: hypothetical protein HKN05_07330 [Rhizobiales bacterium]|nr:hypothetical protein [Hyphomicrobiales bacterium]